jgi:dipeptidyl aminopeptidase/acylaminoacyl peptidase
VTTPGYDFSGSLVLDRSGARALGVRVITDGEQTVWFDEGMKRMQALADEALPNRVNRLNCRRCGADDMVVLVRSYSDREPGRLYLYEAATQRWQAVSQVLDGIDAKRMATVDLHRIQARDGRDLPVWLTLPADSKAGQPLPAVVLVHGGPWVRGGQWQWQALEQFLASRGYLVISPEFRGSTGFGAAHYEAGWKQWGQAMQDDVADALLWARKEGLASDKACIAGASYGGYSALMGLVRQPELYRCGVAWVAVTDPFLLLQGSWWVDDDSTNLVRKHMLPQLIGDADKDAAMLAANSPLAQAKRIKAPLLLAFGESDRRVPLAHGERLRDALREAGRPPEWVSYANEGHSWRQVSTQVDFARRVEKFLDQHLKAEAP